MPASGLPLRTPEISLRSYLSAAAASSTTFERPSSRHAPALLIRTSRIAGHELAAMNRSAPFQAIGVGVLRRSARRPARPRGDVVVIGSLRNRGPPYATLPCAPPVWRTLHLPRIITYRNFEAKRKRHSEFSRGESPLGVVPTVLGRGVRWGLETGQSPHSRKRTRVLVRM